MGPVADTRYRRAAGALKRLFADALHVDLSQSDPIVSGRNALGLVLPLIISAAFGQPAIGVRTAVGGLQVAFADRPGPYRLRVARMLATSAIAAITAFLAAALGNSTVGTAILLAVCAFAAGQLLSLGPSAAQVGVAATVCALVLGHLPESPRQAAVTGLLVFVGGAVQTVLAIAAWPLGRHRPERLSLAALYGKLADLAESPIDPGTSPPLGDAISDTTAVLTGTGHDHGPSVEAYRVLLDEAVRARQDVLVLSSYAHRLSRDGLTGAADCLLGELTAAGAVLRSIAVMLTSGDALDGAKATALLAPIGNSIATLGDSLTEQAAVNRLRGLAGQLRAMVDTARTGAGEGRTDEDHGRADLGIRLRDPIEVIRANLNPHSPAFKHALRLGVLVPLTDIVTREVGIQRGYWVPLTILVVLRPDFGGTFQRSLMRVLGTLVGLLLASVLVHYVLGSATPALIVLLALYFCGMRMSGPTNLGLSAVCVAGLVVVLLSLAGFPAHTTVVDRSIDTAVGGAIALLAALLWPSWERGLVPQRLVGLLTAYRNYLQMMVDPETTAAQRASVRKKARLARSAAEASLDRARAEPVDSHGAVELGTGVLAHSHRLIHALTAIDATRQAREIYAKVPEFRFLLDAAVQTLDGLVLAIGGEPVKFTSLRPLHSALSAALTGGELLPPDVAASVVEATDRLVDSLNSVAAVITDRPRSALEQLAQSR